MTPRLRARCDALTAAGFDELKAWDAAPFFDDAFTPPGHRTFWLARKLTRRR
ncbi:MAG: hypothetical protein NTY38_32655 [Acidobacteria bacterium]|nr:hypothetical protein [Acidobacteriota bacterium]